MVEAWIFFKDFLKLWCFLILYFLWCFYEFFGINFLEFSVVAFMFGIGFHIFVLIKTMHWYNIDAIVGVTIWEKLMEFLTFCSAGRINLKINTKKQNKIYQRRSVVKEKKNSDNKREKEGNFCMNFIKKLLTFDNCSFDWNYLLVIMVTNSS